MACKGEMTNAHKILIGKPERKRPLGRPRHRWEDVRMILGKQGGKVWTGCMWFRIQTTGGLL
jgi:hypothetical protein